ncbi:MAG: aryl-sulfate sulfotransferase [candidate division WOR-3 bacterium]
MVRGLPMVREKGTIVVTFDESSKTGLSRLAAVLFLSVLMVQAQPGASRTMGLMLKDSGAFTGYTLFTPMPYNKTYLIDNDGHMVHSWQAETRPGLSAYLLENGLLLRTQFDSGPYLRGGGAGGRVELVDWDGNVTWSYTYSGPTFRQHHDATALPNGNIMMIAWETKTRAEAIAAGRNPQTIYQSFIVDHIIEVDPRTDSIVWQWHSWDHLIQDFDPTKANYGVVRDHPELIDINGGMSGTYDWTHCNTITYNAQFDQVMISPRYFCEIWVIDHSTTTEEARGHTGGRYGRGGDLLYRWGNQEAYKRGTGYDRKLFQQHDPQWIDSGLPGAGHILVFNNGNARPTGEYTSVDEIVPPMDSLGFYHLRSDSTFGPDSACWSYRLPSELMSDHVGGCQRFENGNTIVCAGPFGTFLEVTPEMRLVWKYINPVTASGPLEQGQFVPPLSNEVFRVRRYSPDYPGLAGRTLTPQGPIERYPQSVDEAADNRPLITMLTAQPRVSTDRFRLRLCLDRPTRVRLAVYNQLGSRVASLVDGELPTGVQEFCWNAAAYAPGTYFCKLDSDSGHEVVSIVHTR